MLNPQDNPIKRASNAKGKHWKLSVEQNKKKSEMMKGKNPHIWTDESKKKLSESKRGSKQSLETKIKRGILVKGEEHHSFIKDRTKLKRFNDSARDRRSYAYIEWRKRVYTRDNFKCRIANTECKGRLEAHHILGYTEHPELRYEINNGITLCHFHHPKKRSEEINLSPYFQKLVVEFK